METRGAGVGAGNKHSAPNRVPGIQQTHECPCNTRGCLTRVFCQLLISGYFVSIPSRPAPCRSSSSPYLQTRSFQNWIWSPVVFVEKNESAGCTLLNRFHGKGADLLIDFILLVSRFFFVVQLVQSCMSSLMTMYLSHQSHCRKWMSSTSF